MALDDDSGVDVAELRAAARAAVHGLVLHFGADVLAGEPVLGVVEDVGDGGHHVAVDAVTEVFLGRNELHAHEIQLAFGQRGVDVVTEGAGPHVDDHILDLRVLLEMREHLLKLGTLLDRLRGDAGFDKFLNDPGRQCLGTLLDDTPLCGNGIAVRIDVCSSIELLPVRDA
nr:hypothetical protein [Nocardia nova]